jgi:hypothetical protein
MSTMSGEALPGATGAPLQGLSGLYPDPSDTTDYMDEGVLEAKANPIGDWHSQTGSQSTGYSGTVPTQSPFSQLDVYDAGASGDYGGYAYDPPPGSPPDNTPTTHSAMYPRGIIQPSWGDADAYSTVGEQINLVHSQDLGGPRKFNQVSPAGHEQPVHWTADDYLAPNANVLATGIPNQLRGANGYGEGNSNSSGAGGSNADVTQGYGVANTLEEFNTGHSMRYVQHDKLGFDMTLRRGESNSPFWGKHPVQQAQFDGPDSPYYEMGDIDGGQIPWEGRIGYPTPYSQAPEPTIAAAQNSPDVWTEY